jgi:hypothetical protein
VAGKFRREIDSRVTSQQPKPLNMESSQAPLPNASGLGAIHDDPGSRSGATPLSDARPFFSETFSLVDAYGLQQSGNLLEQKNHAYPRIDSHLYLVMVCAGMHHQDLRTLMGFLDHVREMMTVVL